MTFHDVLRSRLVASLIKRYINALEFIVVIQEHLFKLLNLISHPTCEEAYDCFVGTNGLTINDDKKIVRYIPEQERNLIKTF